MSRTNPRKSEHVYMLADKEAPMNREAERLGLPAMHILFTQRIRLFHAVFMDLTSKQCHHPLHDKDNAVNSVGGITPQESRARFGEMHNRLAFRI